MPSQVSVETVQALFRLHGFTKDEVFSNQIANTVVQELIETGYLSDRELEDFKSLSTINAFLILKGHVIDRFGNELRDDELFAVLEMLDVLSFFIDSENGLNLPAGPVLRFFKKHLQNATGGNDAAIPTRD